MWFALQSPLLIIVGWTEAMRLHSLEHYVFAERGLLLFVMLPILAFLFVQRHAPWMQKINGIFSLRDDVE